VTPRPPSSRPRLVYIATDPLTAFRLMDGQLAYMQKSGFDVTVITAPGPQLDATAVREGVTAVAVPMKRDPAPLADVVSLARLTATLRRLRPDIVNAGTPKAGLLGVTAARLARVPVIVYLLRGLRFEGAHGARRLLLAATEHVAAGLSHRVFVNSRSLRERFTALGCAPPDKTWIPGEGSSNGVEVERFAPNAERRAWAKAERRTLKIEDDAIVVGFVGRFVRDKGLLELVQAFREAARELPALRLLLVGEHDATDPLPPDVASFIANDPRVIKTGFVDEPARYYWLMDLFVFPSYREGFPNAPLEAAAAELPVVAFRATGTIDAVVDGRTGALVAAKDVPALGRAMLSYARDPALRRQHGAAGARRVSETFRREVVWETLAAEYRRLLEERLA
jgi:glycosyltransferase involved in cell wall biosynthesis